MKNDIIRLRELGKTYSEIQKELKCSKGTISYHCGKMQKEKSRNRLRESRKSFIGYLRRRIDTFQKRDINNKFRDKSLPTTFTVEQFLDKFGEVTNCALTGIEINLKNDRNWSLDHVISKKNGGDNSLDNCQILLSNVNQMKGAMTTNELLNYCNLILSHS